MRVRTTQGAQVDGCARKALRKCPKLGADLRATHRSSAANRPKLANLSEQPQYCRKRAIHTHLFEAVWQAGADAVVGQN